MSSSVGTKFSQIGGDLKRLAELSVKLEPALDFDQPILIFAEVVLSYLPTQDADRVIEWVGKTFPKGTMVLYEQILPKTSFGKVMARHFSNRATPLFPFYDYGTLQEQKGRTKS